MLGRQVEAVVGREALGHRIGHPLHERVGDARVADKREPVNGDLFGEGSVVVAGDEVGARIQIIGDGSQRLDEDAAAE